MSGIWTVDVDWEEDEAPEGWEEGITIPGARQDVSVEEEEVGIWEEEDDLEEV